MVSPASALHSQAERRQRPPNRWGGITEVLEDTVQDRHTLLWGLPLAIFFFSIIVVVIVTVGKEGHSLGAAPSFWLPGRNGESVGSRPWVVVCDAQPCCACLRRHDAQQPAMHYNHYQVYLERG